MMNKVLLFSFAVLISFPVGVAPTFAQALSTFQNGTVADADEINANFQLLYTQIQQMSSGTFQCNTYTSTLIETADCPSGQTLTGGGYAFYDSTGSLADGAAALSRPLGNGWQCRVQGGVSANPEITTNCYARCCGQPDTNLKFGSYCKSNYCIQTADPVYPIHVLYAMTLEENRFSHFPMDVDESFIFPPENIGAASLLVRYEGSDYHVTNVDEQCLEEDGSRHWSDCLSGWENVSIFEAAMRAGTLVAAPGPLSLFNEFQIRNSADTVIRFQTRLSQGHAASDAFLASSGYSMYRVEPGTGNRDDNDCQEHELPFLVSVAGTLHNENSNVSVHADQLIENPGTFPVVWWNGSAFRTLACSNSPAGVYDVGFIALDGLGRKIHLGEIRVTILEERRPGGEIVPNG